jgi:hypothetical protein
MFFRNGYAGGTATSDACIIPAEVHVYLVVTIAEVRASRDPQTPFRLAK